MSCFQQLVLKLPFLVHFLGTEACLCSPAHHPTCVSTPLPTAPPVPLCPCPLPHLCPCAPAHCSTCVSVPLPTTPPVPLCTCLLPCPGPLHTHLPPCPSSQVRAGLDSQGHTIGPCLGDSWVWNEGNHLAPVLNCNPTYPLL